MGGDLFQWNEANWYDENLYRGLRGSYWVFYSGDLESLRPHFYDPTGEGSLIGFRVAASYVPEPGCVALLVCGAIAVLIWWKSKVAVQPNQPQSICRIPQSSWPATVCRSTETASMRASDWGKPLSDWVKGGDVAGCGASVLSGGNLYVSPLPSVTTIALATATSATLALAAFCRKKDLSALGRLLGVLAVSAALGASPASAAITTTGDVEPANPATWTSSTYAYVWATPRTARRPSMAAAPFSRIMPGSGTTRRAWLRWTAPVRRGPAAAKSRSVTPATGR